MRRRVGHYRKEPIRRDEDPVVGCVLIRDVRFFGLGSEAEPPPEFASNVVQGKTYDLASYAHSGYFLDVLDRLLGHHVDLDGSRNRGAALGLSTAIPGWLRSGLDSKPSGPWSWTPTAGAAPSPATASGQS